MVYMIMNQMQLKYKTIKYKDHVYYITIIIIYIGFCIRQDNVISY
jgi:hypothetical protein